MTGPTTTIALARAQQLDIRGQLVVVMQSEMGRPPTCNKGDGKDHWSVGSLRFPGRGITGNRVVGATDERQLHVLLDPATLAASTETGIRIRPEHPFADRFPPNVPEDERLVGLWNHEDAG